MKEKYLPARVRKSYQFQTSRRDLISHIIIFAFLIPIFYVTLSLSYKQNISNSTDCFLASSKKIYKVPKVHHGRKNIYWNQNHQILGFLKVPLLH